VDAEAQYAALMASSRARKTGGSEQRYAKKRQNLERRPEPRTKGRAVFDVFRRVRRQGDGEGKADVGAVRGWKPGREWLAGT